jgi:hypothetical protein
MIIAKGSKVVIGDISGVLAEDLNINLKSNFRPLASDFQNEITKMIDIAGATSRSLFGKGFSSQFKQMTTQVWDKTDPARFNLNVEFHRTFNEPGDSEKEEVSGNNVMKIVKKFCRIPLPDEVAGGMLEPPGPSPIEGIGLDAIVDGSPGANIRGYVNVIIGNMKFNRLLMESAEPTFNRYTDDSGYPISCRVAFSFVSLWAATKPTIDAW